VAAFGTDLPSIGGTIMTKYFLLLLLVFSGGCSSALVSVKRDFAEAYKGIKADLNFHEDDGLTTFDPTSAAIVRQMRNEMQQ
jgi:predicted amino acid-binding ACT domain protein